ncbi:transposase [Edaphobacter paludis]|uniref:Transposase n=1 Tax=Edaphobacter paludis TaxID=3035702 RepID=A0AAU7D1G4_9BACT
MPSRLKRYHGFGHDHFVTFSCYQRLPYLNDDHSRTVFLETFEQLRQRHCFYVFGYVLMPEHVHLLLGEPKQSKLEDIFRALKTQTSKRLKGDRQQFWQRRYHDFNVLTQAKLVEKLRYIHRNPVERGLVQRPEDWPWSSFRHWLTGEIAPVEIESHWTFSRRIADQPKHLTRQL